MNQFKQRDDPPRRRDEDRTDRADRRGGHRGPAGDKDRDGKLEGRVYVISGGPVHGGTVNRARADLRAMIHQARRQGICDQRGSRAWRNN